MDDRTGKRPDNLSRRNFIRYVSGGVLAGPFVWSGFKARPQEAGRPSPDPGEWPSWGRDSGGTRFSPLKQINRNNVASLQRAWTYHTGDISDGSSNPTRTTFECTPLVVDGWMYIVTPFGRAVCLNPETGRERWVYDPRLDLQKRYTLWINRGPAYWCSASDKRLLFGTLDGRLIALDATSGRPCSAFGQKGTVEVGTRLTSPPTIFRDLVIVGGNQPFLRAYDIYSGDLVWTFHKVPPDDRAAQETWAGDSWKRRRGGVAWAPLSVDEERGLIFVPTDSPTYDYYGGDRAGDNLYSNCVLALEGSTGKRAWHFQVSHHDVWDYDLPAQPVLATVEMDGKSVPAVVQVTKQGFLFVLDRQTGQPLFPLEERAVPQSRVPGEKTSPTQPFPLKPPPFARQTMTPEELNSVTPEHRSWCQQLMESYPLGSTYHPGTLDGVIIFPSNQGGGEWGGACFDPETGRVYVNGTNLADILLLEESDSPELEPVDRGVSGRRLVEREGLSSSQHYRRKWIGIRQNKFWDPEKLWPCQEPPWGTLSAIDINKGETAWQVPLGIVEELIEKGIPPTGTINIGGPIVTAGGLVFIGASNDSRLRAFDRDTGRQLWVGEIDGSGHAVPMTYLGPNSGRQYIVIAAGGGNKLSHTFTDALVAFALPE